MHICKNKEPNWCGGCGNYSLLKSLIETSEKYQLNETNTVFCFDIGCSGNGFDKITGRRFHGLHGRVLTAASGMKLSSPNTNIIAISGDGAAYSEGIGHFIHSIRNNYPIIFIVNDNNNYGLTTGQCSSTSIHDFAMNSNPFGNEGITLKPLSLALSMGCGFVAQSFSGDIELNNSIIAKAIEYQKNGGGFAFINILQSCPTYNKFHTQDFYLKNITYTNPTNSLGLTQNTIEHNTNSKIDAIKLCNEVDYPVGIIYSCI